MAFYLTYRPQKVVDLDLENVRQSLGEILASKNIPHAFLFVGPKGTGKTSSARIVAKAVNCIGKKSKGKKIFEPCNKCDLCKMINTGQAMDLIEIDGASNRGIDDIRELRQKVKLAPSLAKYKVYIIDEVHMLTKEAFNALLKTLEEPPAHALFILCTTEPRKIPKTIVSRCWQIDFPKAKVEEIIRSLKRVVKGEGLTINKQDLERIAKVSDGSFRDATKVLEQLTTTGKRISSKRVTEVLERGIGKYKLDEWLVMIYQKQIQPALIWLGEAVASGLDIKQLMVSAVERLRQILLLRLGVSRNEKWEDIVAIDDLKRLKDLIEVMRRAAAEIKGAVVESLPVELAVVEWGEAEEKVAGEEGNDNQDLKDEEKEQKEEKELEELEESKEPVAKLGKKAGNLNLKSVEDRWKEVIKAVRPHNHSLEALLRATKPVGFDGQFLVVEVFYKFHKERLEVDKYRQLVDQVASEVLANSVKIRYHLGNRLKKIIKRETTEDSLTPQADNDIIKTAEEIFGVKE